MYTVIQIFICFLKNDCILTTSECTFMPSKNLFYPNVLSFALLPVGTIVFLLLKTSVVMMQVCDRAKNVNGWVSKLRASVTASKNLVRTNIVDSKWVWDNLFSSPHHIAQGAMNFGIRWINDCRSSSSKENLPFQEAPRLITWHLPNQPMMVGDERRVRGGRRVLTGRVTKNTTELKTENGKIKDRIMKG